jgi:hypothetical protein
MAMSAEYWLMTKASVPWGDYGSLLAHGMSAHRKRVEGRIQLERVGPKIAPVTMPGIGDIIVTSAMKAQLLEHHVTGVTFAPVDKVHISHVDWTGWDPTAKPQEMPETGAPEDYVLGRPHDEAASAALGELWEVIPEKMMVTSAEAIPEGYVVERQGINPFTKGQVFFLRRSD